MSGAAMSGSKAYIIAARRSAIGRLGGLHRNRRIEDLAAPVAAQALADAGLETSRVDSMILGNSSAGGNPARIVALVAGLADRTVTLTVDRHAASGLEAIAMAVARVSSGDAEIIVAGGAEAQSTAPWRIAKPRTLYHMPRFIGLAQADSGESADLASVEATEAVARRLGISRNQMDEHAITSHIRATLARDARRLVKEIVPLRSRPEDGRDELVGEPDIEELESIPAIVGDGLLTAGNTSLPADAAAFVVVAGERAYQQLGRPPALILAASASIGVPPESDIEAPIEAARLLAKRAQLSLPDLAAVEFGETSAAQAIAFQSALDLRESALNADGGQVARGNPLGAAGAVLAVRLFSRLVRDEAARLPMHGACVVGAAGGQALALLFERV